MYGTRKILPYLDSIGSLIGLVVTPIHSVVLLIRCPPSIAAMATAMRSDFMGAAVQSGTAAPKPTAKKFQVSAIFKKAQKQVEKTQQAVKQKLPSKGKATQVVKKAEKTAKKSAPSPPSKKQTQAPQKVASKASSLFQGAKKQASSKGKQVGKQASKQAGGSSKGWFGEERASGLDKWYGTYTTGFMHVCRLMCCSAVSQTICVFYS